MDREKLKTQGHKRSSKWASIRKLFLLEHPTCAVCGKKTKLQVHHRQSFHEKPELELVKSNLIQLCEGNSTIDCHLIIGHSGNFKKTNPDVEKDAQYLNEKLCSKN